MSEQDEKLAALRNALRVLFDNSTVYFSEIEAHHGFDLEEWVAEVLPLLKDQ